MSVLFCGLGGWFDARAEGPPAETLTAGISFVKEWGTQGSDPGQFNIPIGIAINGADEIFVADHENHRIQKFDSEGKFLSEFPTLPNPGGLAIDQDGKLYITHFPASSLAKKKDMDFISVYGSDGQFMTRWGKSGDGEGEFSYPGGLVVSKDGKVYVADQTNHRIQVFDREGKFLLKWGKWGSEPGEFGGKDWQNSRTGGPQFVALDSTGNVWTTEGKNGRIQKFTPEGKFLLAWGDNEDKPGSFGGSFGGFEAVELKTGGPPRPRGRLQGPIALCFDKQDRLWVGAVCGRIQRFSQEGKYLGGLTNEQGDGPGQFFAPHGVAIDHLGCLYVVDSFNHRVQKFAVRD